MTLPTPLPRTLDYVPRLVEANNNFLIRDKLGVDSELMHKSRWWLGGPVLDQGSEGSCVGHGVTGEAFASPVRVKVPTGDRATTGHLLAVDVYNRAKQIDEWEGVDYDGTSVRAGMLVARERKWNRTFLWAKNITEIRQGLEEGPVVIGFVVLSGMWDTMPNGDWIAMGYEVGGHCALVTGYSPNYNRRGQRFRIRNSWGIDWGLNGNAYMTPEDLDKVVFQTGGEAALAQQRGYGLAA